MVGDLKSQEIKQFLSDFCVSKIEKWEQRELVFTFLTRIFNNILKRLNWGLKSFTAPKVPTTLMILDDQSKAILTDFKIIHQFDCITESIFMDWYYQYSKRKLFNLCMYYWESLANDYYDSNILLLKCFRNIKKKHIQNWFSNMEYEAFYEDSNERCKYSYQTIFDIFNKRTELKDIESSKNKQIIKEEFEMLYNEENDHNSLANYLLGIIYYFYRDQNKKYQSLCFLNLLKGHKIGNNDSSFILGFIYFNGHCVIQDFPKALQLFKKAQNQGNHCASLYLGDMYFKSKGVKKNKELAYEFLFQGAFRKHEQCIQYLKKNIDKETFKSYESKYKQGDYSRCCLLGNMLFHAISVPKSTMLAIEYWFLGLEHINCQQCFLQLSDYFEQNQKIVSTFKILADKGIPKYQRFLGNIKKYNLIDLEFLEN